MKRLHPDDRLTLIEALIEDDLDQIRNNGTKSVSSIFRNGIPGYTHMPDDVLLEIAADKDVPVGHLRVTNAEEEEHDYLACWEIDVSGPTPRDAAFRARYLQRPDGTATVFDITHEKDGTTRVDLMA